MKKQLRVVQQDLEPIFVAQRAAALMARFPGIEFVVMQQKNWDRPERFQTITFRGSREALERFGPMSKALAKHSGYTDEFGDLWYAQRYPDGTLAGCVHSHCEGAEAPWRARRWPQAGLSSRVRTMIRRLARSPAQ
ncbi:MAG TPA: hypothetical protein VN660_01765 [Steroidobacteraceae bacterium]|nr:hypothetical protein [Steroidobacteraceae bacterium]